MKKPPVPANKASKVQTVDSFVLHRKKQCAKKLRFIISIVAKKFICQLIFRKKVLTFEQLFNYNNNNKLEHLFKY